MKSTHPRTTLHDPIFRRRHAHRGMTQVQSLVLVGAVALGGIIGFEAIGSSVSQNLGGQTTASAAALRTTPATPSAPAVGSKASAAILSLLYNLAHVELPVQSVRAGKWQGTTDVPLWRSTVDVPGMQHPYRDVPAAAQGTRVPDIFATNAYLREFREMARQVAFDEQIKMADTKTRVFRDSAKAADEGRDYWISNPAAYGVLQDMLRELRETVGESTFRLAYENQFVSKSKPLDLGRISGRAVAAEQAIELIQNAAIRDFLPFRPSALHALRRSNELPAEFVGRIEELPRLFAGDYLNDFGPAADTFGLRPWLVPRHLLASGVEANRAKHAYLAAYARRVSLTTNGVTDNLGAFMDADAAFMSGHAIAERLQKPATQATAFFEAYLDRELFEILRKFGPKVFDRAVYAFGRGALSPDQSIRAAQQAMDDVFARISDPRGTAAFYGDALIPRRLRFDGPGGREGAEDALRHYLGAYLERGTTRDVTANLENMPAGDGFYDGYFSDFITTRSDDYARAFEDRLDEILREEFGPIDDAKRAKLDRAFGRLDLDKRAKNLEVEALRKQLEDLRDRIGRADGQALFSDAFLNDAPVPAAFRFDRVAGVEGAENALIVAAAAWLSRGTTKNVTANLQSVPPTTTDGLGIDYFRRHLVYRSSPAERAFEKELDALFRRELGEADFSKDAVREALGAFAIGDGYQAADPVAFGAQRRLEAIRDQLGGAQ